MKGKVEIVDELSWDGSEENEFMSTLRGSVLLGKFGGCWIVCRG